MMLRKLYLSPLARLFSVAMNAVALLHKPFMAYGYRDPISNHFRKRTRISSSTIINDRKNVSIADNVFISHYCIVDGSNGVELAEGVQLAAGVMIFSHGSQTAIRLLGERFIEVPHAERPGYTRGRVRVGPYSFIGAGAILLPGTQIGKGCLIAAGSVVKGTFDDFSLIRGNPANVVADVREVDQRYLEDETIQQTYFDQEVVARFCSEGRLP